MSDKYIGDFEKGQLVRVKFNTFSQAIIPTAPTVDPTVAVYKDSATEFTTGVTQPTVNFDSKDGVHELVIDTSDAVYEIGKDYDIIFTAGTVDGTDLTRTILRTFSIENRNTDANVTRIAGQTASAAAPVTFPAAIASQASVDTLASYVDTEVAAIKAKTDNLPTDPADASDIAASFVTVNNTLATIAAYIDTEVAAIKAKTDNLPTDPADASDIAASFASVDAALTTIAGYIDTEVAAIKAKTDNLPVDPADASDIAASFSNITTLLNTLATYVDTEVAAIKAKTDNLPANPAAVSDVPTASAIADAVLEESVDAHDNVPHSLAKYISIIKKANTVIDGVVTSATTPSTTSFSSNINYPTGAFKHAVLLFTNAAAINEQNSPLLTYVNPNGVITVEEPFTTAPTVGDEFIIIPTNHVHSIAAIQNGLATSTALAAVATNVTDLVARIPATLFAGITSLANWLGAIAGKTADSTTRAQINATAAGANFNETTDSLEAIRDRGDAAWITGATGQGSGARIVTITVRDSSASPVEAATVRVYRAGETYAGVTNASGVTSFSLDDATFTVAITAAGFSFTPVSLVVSGNVSQTYTLTSTGGVTPSVAPRTTGFWTVNDLNGVAQAGAQVTIQASSPPPGSTGLAMEDAPRTATADNQGVVQFNNLVKGATYIVYRTGSSRKYNIVVPSTAGDSTPMGSIVG
jgi:cell division protein ZapA (FtsZ GTPase activity inhibitor)